VKVNDSLAHLNECCQLKPLFSRLYCVAAMSTPDDEVLSHSNVILSSNKANTLTDKLLETLVCILYVTVTCKLNDLE